MGGRAFIEERWSVVLPDKRNVIDARTVTVECANCIYRFTGRRKDLEFAADPNEFVFENREIEFYE